MRPPQRIWIAVLRSLFENLARAHRDPAAKAIVVIGGNNNFSPGFDIMQFKNQSGGGGIDDKVGDHSMLMYSAKMMNDLRIVHAMPNAMRQYRSKCHSVSHAAAKTNSFVPHFIPQMSDMSVHILCRSMTPFARSLRAAPSRPSQRSTGWPWEEG